MESRMKLKELGHLYGESYSIIYQEILLCGTDILINLKTHMSFGNKSLL